MRFQNKKPSPKKSQNTQQQLNQSHLAESMRYPIRLPSARCGAAILLVTVLVFLGCTDDDIAPQSIGSNPTTVDRENTVIFDIDGSSISDPFNFNWMVPGTSRNQGMHQAVWEPLFILNYATGKIDPWLGKSFIANDRLDIWTLNIRNGVRWSDGQAFDADDIVFTLNLLLNDASQSLSEAASMQQWVDAIEKVDPLTVRFYLKSPNPRFQVDYFSVRVWGGIIVLPQHIWDGQDPFTFKFYDREKGWPVGTGAYQLVAAGETEFIYRRRQDWWGVETGFRPLPAPEQLVWIVTGLEETRALLAAESKLDSVMDITLGAFESIRNQNPRIIAWNDDMPYAWMGACPRQLSVNHTISPWDKAEMRQALSLIIDRQQIIEIAYEGTSVASKTIFVEYPAMQPYIDAIRDLWVAPRGNIPAARALIEANGWVLKNNGFYQKGDQELSLNIQTHEAFIEKRRIAEVIVEQLREVGINATTRALAGSTWTDNKAFGKFEAVIDWDACGSINEPWFTLNRYTSQFWRPIDERAPSNNNFVRWQGEKADQYSQIVARIGILPLGDAEILPLVAEAMNHFVSEQVMIPLTQARKIVPFDTTYWVGWPSVKNNYSHPGTWWMSTHQIIHNLRKAKN